MARQWLSRTSWPVLILVTVLLATLFLAPASGAEGALSGQKICLDPGHGGSDPGAVNVTDEYELYESQINLDVSFALRALLEADGAEVVMTRTGDTYLTNRDRYTLCNGVGADLLISVHTNSSTDADMDGSATLWSKREDVALAEAIHAVLYPSLRDTKPEGVELFRNFDLIKFQSGVLLKSDMPAAMMEPVFMSHPAEAVLLAVSVLDDAGAVSQDCAGYVCRRGQIAQAIYQGILNYYEPTSGGTMYVTSLTMNDTAKGPNYFVNTSVQVVDQDKKPVSGATVSLKATFPDGTEDSLSGLTDAEGWVTLSLKSRATGTYTSEVTGVAKDGWSYYGTTVDNPISLKVPSDQPSS